MSVPSPFILNLLCMHSTMINGIEFNGMLTEGHGHVVFQGTDLFLSLYASLSDGRWLIEAVSPHHLLFFAIDLALPRLQSPYLPSRHVPRLRTRGTRPSVNGRQGSLGSNSFSYNDVLSHSNGWFLFLLTNLSLNLGATSRP